jgi:hypothetical protein
MTLATALQWADSHGLLLPAILGGITVAARIAWGILRPVVLRRAPSAVPIIEGAALRVAALLPDLLGAILRRPARVIVVGTSLAVEDPPRPTTAPPAPSGQSGRATVATLALLALVGIVGLSACPQWDRPRCETPGVYSCVADHPRICAPSRELTPIGDEPCARQGRTCAIATDGRAYCAAVPR